MNQKSKLDLAAKQLLEIFEKHAEGLPAPEREAKWRAFDAVVAKVRADAKSQGSAQTDAS